jgi:hypothetical protein
MSKEKHLRTLNPFARDKPIPLAPQLLWFRNTTPRMSIFVLSELNTLAVNFMLSDGALEFSRGFLGEITPCETMFSD